MRLKPAEYSSSRQEDPVPPQAARQQTVRSSPKAAWCYFIIPLLSQENPPTANGILFPQTRAAIKMPELFSLSRKAFLFQSLQNQ